MDTSSAWGTGGHAVPGSGVLPLELDDPAAIGGHRLVGRLGSGGMGVVYLGRDDGGGLVAVKTARAEDAHDAEIRGRFRTEAECASRIPAACTARVLVDGTAETPPYIITEYVEGPSLADVVDSIGPLPPDRLRELAVGVARALAAIHEAGLVHRDLKPANVLLTSTGPRVIDFGIAQRLPASGGPTKAGVVMGSPGWIPPERLTGQAATRASDVFGWGCLVAYAATGRHPFGRGDGDALAQRMIHEPPEIEGVDEPLRTLVTAALAKDPADRPGAAELVERLSDDTASAGVRRSRRWLTVPVVASVTSAAVAVAAAVAAILATTGMTDHDPSPSPPGEAVLPPAPLPSAHAGRRPSYSPAFPVQPSGASRTLDGRSATGGRPSSASSPPRAGTSAPATGPRPTATRTKPTAPKSTKPAQGKGRGKGTSPPIPATGR